MLKNWFSTARIRNFIKSGFYMDFILKKTIVFFLKKLSQFTTLFLEKFSIEFLFKNLWNLITFFTPLKKPLDSKYIGFLLLFLNIFTCLVLIVFY